MRTWQIWHAWSRFEVCWAFWSVTSPPLRQILNSSNGQNASSELTKKLAMPLSWWQWSVSWYHFFQSTRGVPWHGWSWPSRKQTHLQHGLQRLQVQNRHVQSLAQQLRDRTRQSLAGCFWMALENHWKLRWCCHRGLKWCRLARLNEVMADCGECLPRQLLPQNP